VQEKNKSILAENGMFTFKSGGEGSALGLRLK
jgi:hypothetical protein